jgi:hypothetical protein
MAKVYVSPSKSIVERVEIDRIFVIIRTYLWEKEVCDTIIEGVVAG